MQNIDWANLTFGYYPTNYNVRCYFRNGQWGELEVSSDTSINIHMAATCLHYGARTVRCAYSAGMRTASVCSVRLRAS